MPLGWPWSLICGSATQLGRHTISPDSQFISCLCCIGSERGGCHGRQWRKEAWARQALGRGAHAAHAAVQRAAHRCLTLARQAGQHPCVRQVGLAGHYPASARRAYCCVTIVLWLTGKLHCTTAACCGTTPACLKVTNLSMHELAGASIIAEIMAGQCALFRMAAACRSAAL